MRIHSIQDKAIRTPVDLVGFLEDNDVKSGDTLGIRTEDKELVNHITYYALMMVLVHFFGAKGARQVIGQAILEDLFTSKPIKDIEEEVEKEYGIKVEVEYEKEDDDRKAWLAAGQSHFLQTYASDEPDYSDSVIRET